MSNIFQTLSQFHQTQTKVDVLVVVGLSKPVLNALGALALLAEHVLVLEPNEMLWAAPLAAQRLDHLQHKPIVLAAQAQVQPFYVYNQAGFDGLHNATTAPHAPANLKLVEESTVQTTTLAQLAEQFRPLQQSQRWALLIDIGPEGHPVIHNLPEALHSQLAWVLHAPTQLDHLNLETQGQALQALLEEPITFKKWCFYQRVRPQVNTAEHEAQLALLRDEIQLLQDTLVQQDERQHGMEQELIQAQRNMAEREAQLAHITSVKDGLQTRLKQEIAAAAQHAERVNDELRNVNAQVALVKELLHGAEHQQ